MKLILRFGDLTEFLNLECIFLLSLSGICYLDCANDSVSVPYGTNLPGQTICYRTQRQVAESFSEVQSCAAQLPQTAHHALQGSV